MQVKLIWGNVGSVHLRRVTSGLWWHMTPTKNKLCNNTWTSDHSAQWQFSRGHSLFLLGAYILVEVLGLISRLRGLLTFVSRYFFIRKAPEVIRNTRKGIKRKNRNVRLAPIKLPQCTDLPPLPRCQAIIRGSGARGPSLTIWDAANWANKTEGFGLRPWL